MTVDTAESIEDTSVEKLDPLTEETARDLTTRIYTSVGNAWVLIVEAFTRRAWEPLGYESWDAYCDVRIR